MKIIKEMLEEKKGELKTCDLYKKIWSYVSTLESLKESIEIIEYALPYRFPQTIPSGCVEFTAIVNTGGNEGIYIDLCLTYENEKKERQLLNVGVIKTLCEDMDSYIKMGMIAGALTLSANNYLMLNC